MLASACNFKLSRATIASEANNPRRELAKTTARVKKSAKNRLTKKGK